MKKMIAACLIASAAHGFAAAVDAMTQDPRVVMTSLSVKQRYPWNGKVDIDFSFTSAVPEAFAFIRFNAKYVNASGETVHVPMKTFDQITLPWCTNAGSYRVTWNSTADAPSLTVTNLEYTVTANMAKYMVVDLSKGAAASPDDPYPVFYYEDVPDFPGVEKGRWDDYHKTTNMVFRLIQPGTYTKGWLAGGFNNWHDASAHQATLTRPYYVSVFEVTQEQGRLIAGKWVTGGHEFTGGRRGLRPIACLSYASYRGKAADGYNWPQTGGAVAPDSFIGMFRARTGSDGFDLPTETEWEYAARAGAKDGWGGDGLSLSESPDANSVGPTGAHTNSLLNMLGRYKFNGGYVLNADGTCSAPAWTSDESAGTAVVGSYAPNAWGLYDCLGNAPEITLDYADGGMSVDPTVDDMGLAVPADKNPDGTWFRRVARGGSWDLEAKRTSLVARPSHIGAGHYQYGCRMTWHFPYPPKKAAE